MVADRHPQAMESFPLLQLIVSFLMWVSPPVIAAGFVFFSIPTSSIISVVVLLALVTSVPVSAYVLYRIDLSKNDGYISIWGYR